jgi:hypothetical protein
MDGVISRGYLPWELFGVWALPGPPQGGYGGTILKKGARSHPGTTSEGLQGGYLFLKKGHPPAVASKHQVSICLKGKKAV